MTLAIEPFCMLVDARVSDHKQFAQIAKFWLEEASRSLLPTLWGRLSDALPLPPIPDSGDVHGAPYGVFGSLSVVPRGRISETASVVRPYSHQNFEWVLDMLDRRPLLTEFQLDEFDAHGQSYEEGGAFRISITVLEDSPEFAQFSVMSSLYSEDGDPKRSEVSHRWTLMLRRMLDLVDPSFGHICDDAGPGGSTALDGALKRGGRVRSIMQGRKFLRGYSWVTVCPRELAERLGGASRLKESKSFAKVDELPHGGLWLQATNEFKEYDERAVGRVFNALAPVLPAGQPRPDPFDSKNRRLIWTDAAKHE